MNCEQALDLINARLDGSLSPTDEAELTAHLNSCPHCRAIADDLSQMHSTLSTTVTAPPPQLAQGVMHAIRTQRSNRKQLFRQLVSLAACLVLCVGIIRITDSVRSNMDRQHNLPDMARHVQPFALTDELTFTNVQRIRLSDEQGDTALPSAATLLDSTDALRDLPAVAQTYDADFFLTHRLLVITVQEPSSSIAHTISALTADSVTIQRDVPAAGDSDMARWLILAEVDGSGPETSLTIQWINN